MRLDDSLTDRWRLRHRRCREARITHPLKQPLGIKILADWYGSTISSKILTARLRLARNFAKTRFGRFPTFHFSTPKKKSKLRTAVYPPRMAPFGLKLWENAFQMIPDISFFHAEKKSTKSFDKIFLSKIFFQRRKMKCRGSSETRFPKV